MKLYTAAQLQALISKAEEEMAKYPKEEYDQTQVNAVKALIEKAVAAIEAEDNLAISMLYPSLESAIEKLADTKPHTWIDVPTEAIDLNAGSYAGNWRVEGGGNIGYAYEGGSATFHLNVTETGFYDLKMAVGNPGDGAQMRITFQHPDESVFYTQVADVPNTGGWGSADNITIELNSIHLTAGKAIFVIYGEKKGGNGWVGNTHLISLMPSDPAGISTLNAGEAARQGIYTLQGVRVENPSKGLYIVDGKKVFINK